MSALPGDLVDLIAQRFRVVAEPRLESGVAVVGADTILAYLGEHLVDPEGGSRHRERAEEMHNRLLEDECECSRAVPR
jgi:hypothetical protein